MLFSRRLSVASLIEMCRSLRYSLAGGLMLRDTMDLLANKGTRPLRPVAARLTRHLKSGWSFQDALKKEEESFPPLFVALAAVGEESGNLPEVLAELEKYYLLQQKLRREFVSQITWPLVQFFAAVFIIAALIYILGIVAISRGGRNAKPIDPLGLGLSGQRGAVLFLGFVFGSITAGILLFLIARLLLARRAVVERALLRIPVVGSCLRAIALTRFCVAARLMLETSLSVLKTLRLAFVATDNAAFILRYPKVDASLRRGNTIASSIEAARVFPEKFVSALAVAEESGRLPETLRYQAEEYDDEARRRLRLLTQIAAGLVWAAVATVVIVAIFRIFFIVYLGNIEKVLPS